MKPTPDKAHRIRDYEAWVKSMDNFIWMDGVVPGATDIDCLIHAAGRGGEPDSFLFFEFKRRGERMTIGQRLALEGLAALPGVTVVVVTETAEEGKFNLSMDWSGQVDKEGLKTLVKQWWRAAKGERD